MPLPPESAPSLRGRLLAHWPVKFAGTAAGMIAFFLGYFWVLHHPLRPVTIVPLTALDHWIAFQPAALVFYLSLWPYVVVSSALLCGHRELVSYTFAAVELAVVGLAIFLVWPTSVPDPAIDWAQHPAIAFLKTRDATGNACPSLHVAFAVFSAMWIGRSLRLLRLTRPIRIVNWLWCAGIIYSTIAVRQHVMLDALAGAPLGAIIAGFHLRRLPASS